MSLAPKSWSNLLRDPKDWPHAICPVCSATRPHVIGGIQICDDCREMEGAEDASTRSIREEEERAAQHELRRRNVSELLRKASVPTRYQNFTRASWEAMYFPWDKPIKGFEEVTPKLLEWTGESPAHWLVILYGRYGQRKTGLATALFGERLIAGKKGLWIDAACWIRDMQARFGKDDEEKLYEDARDAEVLLIDDLGSILGARSGRREEQSWWKEQLALLLREREMWVRPTIVTANIMSIAELGQIDHSLVSRMDVDFAFLFDSDKNFRQSP